MPDVGSTVFSRREVMRLMLGAGGCLSLTRFMPALLLSQSAPQRPASSHSRLGASFHQKTNWFLNELESANALFFGSKRVPRLGW